MLNIFIYSNYLQHVLEQKNNFHLTLTIEAYGLIITGQTIIWGDKSLAPKWLLRWI